MKSSDKFLFVFELANNHMGDANHCRKIIDEIYNVSRNYNFLLGFKFQYRQLDTFVHPDYHNRTDIKFVKRFMETKLSPDVFKRIKDYIKEKGFLTICTPFDEQSVDLIEKHKFDYLKIASCSFTDWPLLERIIQTNMPIIASTAGAELDDIDKVVSFFNHRGKDFSLMHCVAEYPTELKNMQLNQIDLLKKRFPELRVGFSTHESPEEMNSIRIAIAKGATIFEKHVGVETEKYKLNAYSANPVQIGKWLQAAKETIEACGLQDKRYKFTQKELKDLKDLSRGIFAKENLKKGTKIELSNVFLSIPIQDNQISANDFSKYTEFYVNKDIRKNQPILLNEINKIEKRKKVIDIAIKVNNFLIKSNVPIPDKLDFEISHHYGIDKFYEYGLTLINFINREYCKKLIILLPHQTHPEQYHNLKEETFHIMYGSLDLTLDGNKKSYKQGDIILVERGVKHKMFTKTGVIIEEISSTHYKSDSYYTDEKISQNPNRKTNITLWVKDKFKNNKV